MIITKEQIDITDPVTGEPSKKILISYTNKDGGISFTEWNLPASEMFKWVFTNKAHEDKPFPVYDHYTNKPVLNEDGTQKYAQWKAFNNKPIRKQKVKSLPPTRVNECINYWGEPLQIINELNIPETWFCDIEVDVDDEGFPDAENARNSINTIAITKFPETIVFGRKFLSKEQIANIQKKLDNYSALTKGYKFIYKYYDTERDMLEDWIDFITPIPAVTGWNFLGYDWQYIRNRCKMLNIDLDRVSPTRGWDRFKLNRKNVIDVMIPRHKMIYDYMLVYQQWDRTVEVKENSTLDFVAGAVLNVKKVKHEWGFAEFYANHYEDYVFYNSVDTILVEKIDKQIETAKIWCALASELKVDVYAAYSTVQPTEIVMSNFLYDDYKVVCSPEQRQEKADYEGAFVWPTQPGIYKYIGGLDFASLYPSIMRQFNISSETFIVRDKNYIPGPNEIKTTSGAVFSKEKGLIPSILDVYYAKRKAAKNNKKKSLQQYEDYLHIYKQRFGTDYVKYSDE
jgi:DNA polymerase elongation subunit (family B)